MGEEHKKWSVEFQDGQWTPVVAINPWLATTENYFAADAVAKRANQQKLKWTEWTRVFDMLRKTDARLAETASEQETEVTDTPVIGVSEMHSFADLANRSANFTLGALQGAEEEVIGELRTSGATRHVKNLQMIQLSRAILAVGMFSIFESVVQDKLDLGSGDGFAAVRECLKGENENDLDNRFAIFVHAINVLKHGRGRSYDALVAMDNLPFKIKRPDDDFFFEGDVSEVATLIEVDDQFVRDCADIIAEVTTVVNKVYLVGL